jgi:hypothetical protein
MALEFLNLNIAFPYIVGAACPDLLDCHFEPQHLLTQRAGRGLGRAQSGAGSAFLRLRERQLPREIIVAGLELLQGECLARGFCSEGAERVGDGFAVGLVAISL